VSSACPGCGLTLPESDGPTHPYIGASAACWELYGRLLAGTYGQPDAQLAVDAYAAQHPGEPGRRQAQSVALHLATLCTVLECGGDPQAGPARYARMAEQGPYEWLEPPATLGAVTVADVLAGTSARAWAESVWAAWTPHHAAVRALLA